MTINKEANVAFLPIHIEYTDALRKTLIHYRMLTEPMVMELSTMDSVDRLQAEMNAKGIMTEYRERKEKVANAKITVYDVYIYPPMIDLSVFSPVPAETEISIEDFKEESVYDYSRFYHIKKEDPIIESTAIVLSGGGD